MSTVSNFPRFAGVNRSIRFRKFICPFFLFSYLFSFLYTVSPVERQYCLSENIWSNAGDAGADFLLFRFLYFIISFIFAVLFSSILYFGPWYCLGLWLVIVYGVSLMTKQFSSASTVSSVRRLSGHENCSSSIAAISGDNGSSTEFSAGVSL